MKQFLILLGLLLISLNSFCQEQGSIIGRPYNSFETTAFCSYEECHPSQYLTDNNWDILCAFVNPGRLNTLDSLGISYNKSQLRLLEVGDLLSVNNGVYYTTMKIFDQAQTASIRNQTRQFADSIFQVIEPDVKELISEFIKAGYSNQVYSLIFSYLLDCYIWDDVRLASPVSCQDHGTWSGAYWAMFNGREHVQIGTNGYGLFLQNWTENLRYRPNSDKLELFAREVMKTNGNRIENQEIIDAVAGWGLLDENGNILIPVIHANNNDGIDVLCKTITDELSNAVKRYCSDWHTLYNIPSEKLGQIIFYHEVMWDLLEIFEAKGLLAMPPILNGEEVGKQHFGDICFIVIEDTED